jgi:WS/DGAT C-terminal domain
LQGLAGPIASQLPVTPFNLVCTNVPGPQFPLYLMGHKMIDWYPYVPVGGEMAVNCAILSYNGKVYFGFSGDVHAAPDLKRMEKLLILSFNELRESIGPGKPDKERARNKRCIVPAVGAEAKTEPAQVPVTSPASPMNTKREAQPAAMAEPKPAMAQFIAA